MRRIFSLLILVVACNSNSGGGGGPGELVDAWKKSGLEPTAFVAVDGKPVGADACQAGKVSGIDTTICSFPDAEAARRAEAAGLAQVGDATGAALAHGSSLLVMADHTGSKGDSSGKTLKSIAAAFRNR